MVAQEDASEFVPGHILITGGAGFIASHVAIRLVQRYPQYKVAHCGFHCSMCVLALNIRFHWPHSVPKLSVLRVAFPF